MSAAMIHPFEETRMHAHDRSPTKAPPAQAGSKAFGRAWWIFGGFAAFVVILFVLEHRAHLVEWLPWVILLACPLMHFFMHGSHGGHGDAPDAPEGRRDGSEP